MMIMMYNFWTESGSNVMPIFPIIIVLNSHFNVKKTKQNGVFITTRARLKQLILHLQLIALFIDIK